MSPCCQTTRNLSIKLDHTHNRSFPLWFSPGPTVSSINKSDLHDIAELLLKVGLNTTKQTNKQIFLQ